MRRKNLLKWLFRRVNGRDGTGMQASAGLISTEIPHVVLLAEVAETKDSLGAIIKRHGLKRGQDA